MDEAREEEVIKGLRQLAVATREHMNVSHLLPDLSFLLRPPMFFLSLVQEVLRIFDMKNRFLQRIIPQLRPIGELVQEKKEAEDRAEKAEYWAQKAIERELGMLREENKRLQNQNLELTSSAHGLFLIPTFAPLFL